MPIVHIAKKNACFHCSALLFEIWTNFVVALFSGSHISSDKTKASGEFGIYCIFAMKMCSSNSNNFNKTKVFISTGLHLTVWFWWHLTYRSFRWKTFLLISTLSNMYSKTFYMHQVLTLIPNRIQNFVSSKTDFKNSLRSRKRQMMEMILNWNIFGREETLFVKLKYSI